MTRDEQALMARKHHPLNGRCSMARNGDEPEIDQGILNGCDLSWNPDDNKFYVTVSGETLGVFQNWHNAVYFARKQK